MLTCSKAPSGLFTMQAQCRKSEHWYKWFFSNTEFLHKKQVQLYFSNYSQNQALLDVNEYSKIFEWTLLSSSVTFQSIFQGPEESLNIRICIYLDGFPEFLKKYKTGIPLGIFRYIPIFEFKQPMDFSNTQENSTIACGHFSNKLHSY